jgi:hypothetical protein
MANVAVALWTLWHYRAEIPGLRPASCAACW